MTGDGGSPEVPPSVEQRLAAAEQELATYRALADGGGYPSVTDALKAAKTMPDRFEQIAAAAKRQVGRAEEENERLTEENRALREQYAKASQLVVDLASGTTERRPRAENQELRIENCSLKRRNGELEKEIASQCEYLLRQKKQIEEAFGSDTGDIRGRVADLREKIEILESMRAQQETAARELGYPTASCLLRQIEVSQEAIKAGLPATDCWVPVAGQEIDDRVLKRYLASGANGNVWMVQAPGFSEPQAMKIFKPGCGADSPIKTDEYFVLNALSLYLKQRNLAVPEGNLVPDIYGNGEVAGRCYFGMELAPGTSIVEWLNEGKLTLEGGLRFSEQICRVFEALHEGLSKSFYDLNSGSLFWDGQRAMALDFGILSRKKGERSSTAKDVFHPEDDLHYLVKNILARLPGGRENLGVKAILDKGLSEDLAKRYQSAHELRADLENALATLTK